MNSDETLIVGQGLAGTLLAWHLHKAGKPFLVMDEERTGTSSRVAAGIFNPINSKRMVKNWMAEELIPYAIETYEQLHQLTGQAFLHHRLMYNVLSTVKEQNDLSIKAEDKAFSAFINPEPIHEPNLKQDLGVFEVNHTGWVNTNIMLDACKHWLQHNSRFVHEVFDHNLLQATDDGNWTYKSRNFKRVIFCEGHRYHLNPFFQFIPYTPTRGDVLTIRCEGISREKMIKKGVYVVHIEKDTYKVGATYDRVHITEEPSAAGRKELEQKLHELLDVPFEVIGHEAGLRPTMRDRKPVIGEHPIHKNLYIVNGLGAKGVMLGPWFTNMLVKNIFEGTALPADIRVSRMYPNA